MRYLSILMFAVLASHPAFAGNDSTETRTWNNRVNIHMTATSALEPGYARGASHVAPGFEYIRYFHIGGLGGVGIGAKISQTFVEQFPLNIPTRLQETWLEIAPHFDFSSKESRKRFMASDAGVYIGCLLGQSIHVQPGSDLPEDVKKDVGFLGYYRVGVSVDFAFPMLELPDGAVVFGLTFRSDMATFGKNSDRRLSAKQTSVGVYFGVVF